MIPVNRRTAPMRLSLCIAGLLGSAAALADDGTGPSFDLSGFGTFAAVRASTDDARLVASRIQADGAGTSIDAGVDSKLGVQGTARLGGTVSATVQVLSKQTADHNFTPSVEWAFVKFAPSPAWTLRAGRIVTPLFMVSDYRDVGYATPWIRPPVEVYGSVPITHSDGIDALYRTGVGNTTLALQALYGKARQDLPPKQRNTVAEVDDILGINLTAERGSLTGRIAWIQGRLTYDAEGVNGLVAGLRQAAPLFPPAAALADEVEVSKDRVAFFGLGASYDDGTWLVQAETTRVTTAGGANGNWKASYATLGYRVGAWQPTLTYAKLEPRTTLQNTIPAAGPLLPLSAGVDSYISGASEKQNTLSLAVRYDFRRNLAAKLQLDRVHADPAASLLAHMQPGFSGKLNAVSIGIDFVF